MNKKTFTICIWTFVIMLLLPQSMTADNVTQAQFDAAYSNITNVANQDAEGKFWYRIFTYCINGETGESGTTRYYLTPQGTLTSDEEQAGTFQFQQVGEDAIGFSSAFSEDREKAFFVKNNGKYFTNASRAIGSNIRTNSNGRPTYEAQVFFMNDNEQFAIRSTNAIAGGWWEASWWTVNSEGVACYTEPDATDDDITHAAFIWELEVAEANDFVNLDETKHYNLSFTQLSNGSTYKYFLSPSYYDEIGYSDSLIHRTNSRVKQMKIAATPTGTKNTYFLQDVLSGYYIQPATNNANGSEWYIGSTPSPVRLEMTGETDTYTLSGEKGGKANPLGNDTNPYKVGNWNGSNNILFTLIDDSKNPTYYNNIKPAYDALTNKENANEDGEFWYRIFTYSEDGKTTGQTKYYITPSGTLSDKAAEAGSFQFISVGEASEGISTMAFKVRSGSNYFTNPNKSAGTSLRLSTRNTNTYEAQIFCLKDGKYAVRATNAEASGWWEQSWWTVSEPGICCYTDPSDDAAAYIWEVEKVKAIDDKIRFDENVYYTITLNKNLVHKYIQSPIYNETNDNVLHRTSDESQIFTAQMQSVEGIKNGFTVKDKESGMYITPATNKNNGTVWTVSENPSTVIFTETAPGIYTMANTQGAFANAYNDDKEGSGYPVANYTSASTWIFTAKTNSDDNFSEEMLNQMTDAAYTIGEDAYYKIFTTSLDGGKTFSSTKYYVTEKGELTTDNQAAGIFNFIAVGETSEGFCNYAYYIKNGANHFTNANKTEGVYLRTTTLQRPTYDAQVFLMNEDEHYAIRSTNAIIGTYWEDAWWNATLDETNTPVACYTLPGTANAKYIWELETAEANDYLQFDSNAAYTITANKSGLVHSFIQSQKYNEPGDLTLHRTDDGSKAIHLTITPVSNKKNYFMLRDKESNLCITPSETTEAGDEWTFSEDGEVYLERISENVYFMSGENGAMANAYGDDNETNGYKVAHYGVASQWIITIAGSADDPVQISDIKTDKTTPTSYTLQGIRQEPITKGLYIINGKKVFINK